MEDKILDTGTKVRIFAQRIEHQERTKSGWQVRVETKPERFGVIEKFVIEYNYQYYRVQFPSGSIEEVHPTQLEPYEWD
jgi:hypothetical protein